MIVPGSSFRCGFAIELTGGLLMIEKIQQLGGKTGSRARSAREGYTCRERNFFYRIAVVKT
jgi:hypothetical protein